MAHYEVPPEVMPGDIVIFHPIHRPDFSCVCGYAFDSNKTCAWASGCTFVVVRGPTYLEGTFEMFCQQCGAWIDQEMFDPYHRYDIMLKLLGSPVMIDNEAHWGVFACEQEVEIIQSSD